MPKPTGGVCAACRWWRKHDDDTLDSALDIGDCRRYPRPFKTHMVHFCGEFARQPKKRKVNTDAPKKGKRRWDEKTLPQVEEVSTINDFIAFFVEYGEWRLSKMGGDVPRQPSMPGGAGKVGLAKKLLRELGGKAVVTALRGYYGMELSEFDRNASGGWPSLGNFSYVANKALAHARSETPAVETYKPAWEGEERSSARDALSEEDRKKLDKLMGEGR